MPTTNTSKRTARTKNPLGHEQNILVLQGGGALGAYQGGVFEALHGARYEPHWVAGISIGAINAALICGNPPDQRVHRLREFWELVTSASAPAPADTWASHFTPREALNDASAAQVVLMGVPGFFKPRFPPPPFQLRDDPDAKALAQLECEQSVDVVHLIYRSKHHETHAKDYEFSRWSMEQHWSAGHTDIQTTLNHPRWQQREIGTQGLRVFDLATPRAPSSLNH